MQVPEFALHVSGGNAVPISVLEFEHVDLLLLDSEDRRMRNVHCDRVVTHIDRNILPQIEARFHVEGSVELHPFRAGGPRVLEFVFDFRSL